MRVRLDGDQHYGDSRIIEVAIVRYYKDIKGPVRALRYLVPERASESAIRASSIIARALLVADPTVQAQRYIVAPLLKRDL